LREDKPPWVKLKQRKTRLKVPLARLAQ